MNAQSFAYWLQGMLEYRDISTIPADELKAMMHGISEHLKLVFEKVTADPVKKVESEKPGATLHEQMKEELKRQQNISPSKNILFPPVVKYPPMPNNAPCGLSKITC